jgi:phosphoribosylformimino-5-aminoimidazole carboxamide ribotide isomerase
MQIIPVIDLLNGVVVHAKRGQRAAYQPIQSQLTASSAPLDIVAALLQLYPFQTLYIADLDAICGTGNNESVVEAISQAHPQLTIWLDCGIAQMNARALYNAPQIRAVIGSESIVSLQDYRAISYACQSKHVLSLDYSATSAMGISELHENARFWPDDTICMTLNAVGSGQGVDCERLNSLIKMNSARKSPSRIYAAGGVRGLEDLEQLKKMGVSGALLATALHQQQISSEEIESLAG